MIDEPKLLTDNFDYTGQWFFPGCDDYKVEGTVNFSKGSISIKVRGPLRDETKYQTVRCPDHLHIDNEKIDTLLGITDNGTEITLESLVMTNSNIGISFGHKYENRIYHVSRMFVGIHYNNNEERKFNSVTIKYSNFKEWINESGINTDQNFSTGTFTITATPPMVHEGRATDDFEYSIWADIKNPGFVRDAFDAKISQDTLITLKSEKKSSYEEFYKIHTRLKNFIMLGILYSIKPLLIEGNSKDSLKEIFIYPATSNVTNEHAIIENRQMFFRFKDLSGRVPTVFQRWLKAYEELEDAFNLFFEVMINDKLYPQDRFENIIQALEAYHRERFDDALMDNTQYEQMVSKILAQLQDPQEREWIHNQKLRGNDLSLPQKLLQLLEQFPYLYTDLQTREKFVGLIRDTRNYFAHHPRSLRVKAAKNAELYYLEQRLNVLMVACMFSELGFDEDKLRHWVIKYAKRRKQFKLVWHSDPFDWF